MRKHKPHAREKTNKPPESAHREHSEVPEEYLKMRRSTVADVRRRRTSITAQRSGQVRKQSVGSAMKEMEKPRTIGNPRSNSNLLSLAVKEDVQQRASAIFPYIYYIIADFH